MSLQPARAYAQQNNPRGGRMTPEEFIESALENLAEAEAAYWQDDSPIARLTEARDALEKALELLRAE